MACLKVSDILKSTLDTEPLIVRLFCPDKFLGVVVPIPTSPSEVILIDSPAVFVWNIIPSSPFALSMIAPSDVVYRPRRYVLVPPICKAGTGDNVLYGESTDAKCIVSLRDNSSTQNIGYAAVGNSHVFMKDATEKMQLTADGTLLLGQTSASSSPGILEITGTSNTMGTMRISPGSGKGSEVSHVHYGSTGDIYWRSSSTSGKVILQDTGGVLLVGKSGQAITTGGMIVTQNDYMSYSNTSTDTGDRCVVWNRQSVSTQGDFEEYRVGNSKVGSVSRNSSGNMVYGTHSDYRLKENVNYTWDATTLLKQLKPCKFEWVSSDFDNINQGFLAHEVQDIVPQAVMGSKDAVDSEGEAVHQQLDNSQLVPLLVKTIQELEARIATLEG